jgi:hypothetical protein
MRDDHLAESILALVTTPDRASAAIGDLMEDLPHRGKSWFWLSTLRTAAGCVWRDVTAVPLRMAGAAFIGWFGYMFLAALLLLVGYVLTSVAWIVLHVLTQHTGPELLTDILHLRFEWDPLPRSLLSFSDVAGTVAIGPFYFGQIVAMEWRERSIAFTVMLALVWLILLSVLPLSGIFGGRVSIVMLPAIMLFLIAGVVKMRRAQILASTSADTTNA